MEPQIVEFNGFWSVLDEKNEASAHQRHLDFCDCNCESSTKRKHSYDDIPNLERREFLAA
jgi:hypothetical protein